MPEAMAEVLDAGKQGELLDQEMNLGAPGGQPHALPVLANYGKKECAPAVEARTDSALANREAGLVEPADLPGSVAKAYRRALVSADAPAREYQRASESADLLEMEATAAPVQRQ